MPENEFGFDESKDFDVLDFGEKTSDKANQRSKYIEENLWDKLEKANKRISLAKDILALIRYVSDSNVAWYRKAVVIAGLIYFVSPADEMSGDNEFITYLDDLGVINAVIKFLGRELVPYYDPDYKA
jgi:uncharacterized membrane protein YkvA (DUF1232 family)